MNVLDRSGARCICSLILLALLATAPAVAFAQSSTVGVPENARAKAYGSGWECDPGYREVNGGCAGVEIPANAYPTNESYGSGWECDRGFRQLDETCVAINVPQRRPPLLTATAIIAATETMR